MTRELKLALIVGFALVLLVTVLISDHLSKARKATLATDIADAPSGVIDSPNQPSTQPIVQITQGAGGGVTMQPPVLIGPAPLDLNAALVSNDPARDPVILGQIGSRSGEVVPELPPMVATGKASMANGLSPDNTFISQAPVAILPSDSHNPIAPIDGAVLPNFNPNPVSQDPILVDPRIAPPAEPKAATAEARWHTVVSGDSAYSIAKKYYGKGELWTKIKEANGDRIGSKGQLRLGVKVKIPDPAAIGLKGVELPKASRSGDSTNKPRETRIADSAPRKSGPREYTVQRGDTLGKISQKQLGTTNRTNEIMRLNKELRNPNALREGMKLMLPAA